MKILLISPSSGNWKGLGQKKLFNGKTFRFSMLSLLTVAALTPDEDSVTLIDEQIDTLPKTNDFDLVGITMMTAAAPRTYELCKYYHHLGIPVVLGGFHASFNVEEALHHADAVVVGPATNAWPELLADFKQNNLKQVYYGDASVPASARLPKHLLKKSAYLSINTTFATLGCRNECSFCSITAFYQGKRYVRPVEEVVSDLQSFPEKFVMFIDDNLTQDREYILDLLKAITPLKKKWVTQASVEISDDTELLEHMKQSGCVGVFIGLESFSESALCSQNKKIKSPQFYKDAIARIHQYGLIVEAGLIFGFDSDDRNVFETTFNILQEIGIDVIQVSILTPLPGTKLFEEMRERIVDFNWEHYDYKYAVFEPANMTRKELKAGMEWLYRKFYSPWNILKRLPRWLSQPKGLQNFYYPLFVNFAYWGRQYHFNIRGYNPAAKHAA